MLLRHFWASVSSPVNWECGESSPTSQVTQRLHCLQTRAFLVDVTLGQMCVAKWPQF